MKNNTNMKKYILILSLVFSLLFWSNNGQAQTAPPPPTGGHGLTANQVAGGSAPIGGGLFILLGLGAAYAGKKLYNHKKSLLEE